MALIPTFDKAVSVLPIFSVCFSILSECGLFFSVVGLVWLKRRFDHISLLIILGNSSLEAYLEGNHSSTLAFLLVCFLIFGNKSYFPAGSYHFLAALGCVLVVGDVRGAGLRLWLHRLCLSFHLLQFLCHSELFWVSYEHNSEFGSGCFMCIMWTADCIFSLVISGVLILYRWVLVC